MESQGASPNNPLGLNLDFLFGRGYLWAKHERLSDWIALEHLRMEIPDLKFPFDARGGLSRFRNTRCLVRDIELSTSEVGLGDLLRQAASELESFRDLEVRFLDGAAHVSTRVRSLGSNAYLSFRVALIPPEPARADEVHLSVYGYRSFGVLPYPGRLLVFELITRLLNTPVLRPPGRGQSFKVGIAGDILSFRPLKLMLLNIFPTVGWKLPNLSDINLDGVQIRPGLMTLRAASREAGWASPTPPQFQLGSTAEGAMALAAYEAKDLFSNADQALFDSQVRQAMQLYEGYRDIYGAHPELISRMLDVLLADPTPSNLAQAESLCRELEREEPDDPLAAMARPTLAQLQGRDGEVLEAYDRFRSVLRDRGETHDWVLASVAAAEFCARSSTDDAARRLRDVLKISPRNRVVLEMLKEIYSGAGQSSDLEEVLKRLTGVYTERDRLTETYLELAQHLMDRQGELGEARIYLERVLRMDPTQLDALHTLGESYVMGGEALRALKAFGSAARAAENAGRLGEASRLHGRLAHIWRDEVGDASQALMSCRRALELSQLADHHEPERTELLEFAADLCLERERWDESIGYLMDVLPVLERQLERASASDRREALGARLIRAHARLARIYDGRGRSEAAATHWRRVHGLDPLNETAIERLDQHYVNKGEPERLVEFYEEILQQDGIEEAQRVRFSLGLAEVLETLELVEDASSVLARALRRSPGNAELRQRLVGVLSRSGRHETLATILKEVLPRATDRDARWALLMTLGGVELDSMSRPREAVRSFMQALKLRPARVEALARARVALEALVAADGFEGESPVGDATVGEVLERVLVKIAEVATESSMQFEALTRRAELARSRSDEATARESERRALEIKAQVEEAGGDVDSRLEAILDAHQPQPSGAEPGDEDPNRRARVDAFRERFEKAIKSDPGLPRFDQVTGATSLGRVLKRDVSEPDDEEMAEESEFGGAPDAGFGRDETTRALPSLPAPRAEETTSNDGLRNALSEASDVHERVSALEALFLAEGQGAPSDQERLKIARELGELAYYELEDSERAIDALEFVRERDPRGLGAQPAVLNALESIYEESGKVEGRIAILEDRLASAESEEMDTVYRLLLAQLVWAEERDRDEVDRWLSTVLERDARHEAAHRLLADVAYECEDWTAAVEHLRTVLSVSSGGLDTVEVERELAEVLLTKLNRPQQALGHFRKVLKAAPGDSGALNRIKESLAALEDWDGYVEALSHELGMLLGKPDIAVDDVAQLEVDAVAVPLRVPASQIIADMAHVVETELELRERARRQWGVVAGLWPEHVEALERRIDLDRALDHHEDLAHDLESYADLLLDPGARFGVLVESAKLYEKLDDVDSARTLYTQALAVVENEADAPEGVDEARRALRSLMNS